MSANRIRAKFYVRAVTECAPPGGAKDKEKVELGAVYATGGERAENVQYAKATPQGTLTMEIDNPEAFGFFTPGRELYLDFTPSPTRCSTCHGTGGKWEKRESQTDIEAKPSLKDVLVECEHCAGSGLEPA